MSWLCFVSEPSSDCQTADLQQRPETAGKQGSRKPEDLPGKISHASVLMMSSGHALHLCPMLFRRPMECQFIWREGWVMLFCTALLWDSQCWVCWCWCVVLWRLIEPYLLYSRFTCLFSGTACAVYELVKAAVPQKKNWSSTYNVKMLFLYRLLKIKWDQSD